MSTSPNIVMEHSISVLFVHVPGHGLHFTLYKNMYIKQYPLYILETSVMVSAVELVLIVNVPKLPKSATRRLVGYLHPGYYKLQHIKITQICNRLRILIAEK